MTQKILDFAKFKLAAKYTPTGETPDETITIIAISEIYNLLLQRQLGNLTNFRLTITEKEDKTKFIRVGISGVASESLVGGKKQYVLNIRESDSSNLMVGLANDDDGTNNDDNIIETNLTGLDLLSFSKDSSVNLNVGTGEYAELETRFEENVANRFMQAFCFDQVTDVSVGDGRVFLQVPAKFNGDELSVANASVLTAGVTGDTTIQIYNVTQGYDMLSTPITIESGELTGSGVVDATKKVVSTGDILRIDIDTVSTGTAPKGLITNLEFLN
ncbi:MAG: hypothetical protein DRP02_02395 [Candidatus Gerdarchaeota archaeon]|nr:MAG: hypothetical protein DRP02_02395 [Candidatus Gerdarchaeota archaeon]